jgi:hypothetical protein
VSVTISQTDYDTMLKRLRWLDSLEAAGVDNWEGISEAADLHREANPEDED